MENLTTIPPLSHRRDAKALVQASKYEFLPDHPMTQKFQGLTKNRLRRDSFLHEAKKLTRTYAEKLGPSIQELPNTHISTTAPLLYPSTKDYVTKKTLTLSMLADEYPKESWTHIYTDG
jgi:hypothetical protein